MQQLEPQIALGPSGGGNPPSLQDNSRQRGQSNQGDSSRAMARGGKSGAQGAQEYDGVTAVGRHYGGAAGGHAGTGAKIVNSRGDQQ